MLVDKGIRSHQNNRERMVGVSVGAGAQHVGRSLKEI